MNRFANWSGHSWLCLPMRWYLGYVFIFACLHKIAHPGMFALDVATYDILPLSMINLMAIVLPWAELVAGILLIAGYKTRAASWMIFGMMVIFIVSVALALAKGLDMSCGCFASQGVANEDPISMMTIYRDAGWLLLSVYVLLFDKNALGLDRVLSQRRRSHA